ncbi:MAG: hypothetical protein L3J28_05950 [Candidatus Polarisedimenticolaceae bacterium]|nr:hypothetical protein [Candidatus Polarisedimenticolaceae bacterium]
MAKASPDCDVAALSLYQEWVNSDEHAKRVSALQGLLNRLFIFVYGSHTDRLNSYQPDIDVETIVRGGKSVYFHLPLTDYTRSVAIALVEMFHEAYISTLVDKDNETHNLILKMRLPLPSFDGWEEVCMPSAVGADGSKGEGLNFWLKYMDRANLMEIQSKAEGDAAAYEELI